MRYERSGRKAMRVRALNVRVARSRRLGGRARAKFDRLFNEKVFDELASLYTEDFVMIDHRPLGREERHGQQVMVEQCRSTVATTPTAGLPSVPSEAVAAGNRRTIWSHMA